MGSRIAYNPINCAFARRTVTTWVHCILAVCRLDNALFCQTHYTKNRWPLSFMPFVNVLDRNTLYDI